MAVTLTPRLRIPRWPLGSDPFTRAQRNTTADELEARVALYGQGTLGARPAATAEYAGTYYTVTDPAGGGRLGALYYCTGTAWLELNPAVAGGFAEQFLHGGY